LRNISLLSVIFLVCISLNAQPGFKSDININSDSIEFLKESDKINFFNNVEINSEYVNIKAESAIYDHIKNVISFKGSPSFIKSKKDDNLFDGKAETILFFNDEKIHLIGNASMKYENLSISSNSIIFNPQTGKMSSG
tara:strand:- start:256 stop:669 length:414 start_codon:yes stop_codon:yes gene_type:complete